VFEIYGDGKRLWASPVMSGLDAAKSVTVSVEGVERLRLVVTDAATAIAMMPPTGATPPSIGGDERAA